MASAGPGDTLTLSLQLTTHPTQPTPSHHPLSIARTSSIKDLKTRLANEWDGKPAEEGIVCVLGGRVCRDTDIVGELFPEATTATSPPILHIIVKGSAWTAPFTTPPAVVAATPTPTPTVPVPTPTPTVSIPTLNLPADAAPTNGYTPGYPTTPLIIPATPAPSPNISPIASLGPSVSGYPTYLAFLSQLIPLQRALLLLNLQKAHFEYEEAIKRRRIALGWGGASPVAVDPEAKGEEEIEEVKNLLIECGLWSIVVAKEEEAELEVEVWAARQADPNGEFQVVQIGGLPYMLHMPPGHVQAPSVPALSPYLSLKRAETIHHILTTLLQLLMTYQPTSPAIAYGRALLRPAGAAGAAGGANPHDPAAPHAPRAVAPAARRRATLSIVINLEAMISILVPLFLLSLKLAFLLWIFGRHASASKRIVLFVMAVGWVAWEGWVMQRRRAALGAGRDRLERANRRAAAAAAAAAPGVPAARRVPQAGMPAVPPAFHPAAALPRQPAPAAAAGGAPAAAGIAPLQPRGRVAPGAVPRPRVREPVSRLSPRYWLNWIAAIGLAEEARELGLVPRSIAGRPVVAPLHHQPRPDQRRRAWRTALVALVLFFGTLSPEVEKKRKRALEKRERLLAARRVAKERKAALALAMVQVSDSTDGQPGAAEQRDLAALAVPDPVPGSGASTPGVFEADDRSMSLETAPVDPPTTPTPAGSSSNADAGPSTSTPPAPASGSNTPTPIPSPSLTHTLVQTTPVPVANTIPQGRGAITDAELFADGLAEPDQLLGDLADQEQAVAEERVEDTETDDEDEAQREEDEGEAEGEVDQIVALF
ncbi:hypothetical protein RQP46_010431 [Phenoliferia psychrophenolica]